MNEGSSGANASEPRSRRSVLDLLLGVGVLGWFASIAFPVLRYLKPLSAAGPEGPIALTADEAAQLGKDKFVILKAGTARVLVFEDASQEIRSCSAKCTHEGCTVQFSASEQSIVCACHNGRFDLDGRNISGPPPRPLTQFTVLKDEAGNITVNTGKVV